VRIQARFGHGFFQLCEPAHFNLLPWTPSSRSTTPPGNKPGWWPAESGGIDMARVDQSGIVGKIRDKPITHELEQLLKIAAEATGIDGRIRDVRRTARPRTVGAPARHVMMEGGPADLQLIAKRTPLLTFTDQNGGDVAPFRDRGRGPGRDGNRSRRRVTWATRPSMWASEPR